MVFSGRPDPGLSQCSLGRGEPHSGLLFDLLSAAHGLGSCLSGGRAVAAALPPRGLGREAPLCVPVCTSSLHLCCVVDGSVWSSSVLLSQNLRSLSPQRFLILQRDISPSEIQCPVSPLALAPRPGFTSR